MKENTESAYIQQCNGKINEQGVCEKCGCVSQSSSAYCVRFINTESAPFLTKEDLEKATREYRFTEFSGKRDPNINETIAFREGMDYVATKANAKIAELEKELSNSKDNWTNYFAEILVEKNNKIIELEKRLADVEKEREDVAQILEVVSERWGNDFAGSTVGIIGRKAKELLEQFKSRK